MPTDLVRRTDQNLISREQRDHLAESVQAWLNVRLDGPLKEVSAEEWLPITRQMYAAVAAAGRTGRIDTFNGNYGMFRRLASAFLISAVANTIVNWPPSHFATSVLLLAAVLSVIRICRFARHYARELFVQFLQISIGTKV